MTAKRYGRYVEESLDTLMEHGIWSIKHNK